MYFYKDEKGNKFCLKTERKDLTPITEEEFYSSAIPKDKLEKITLIAEKKALLNKYKEDVEQVELFGMERTDYEEKKQLCKELILELRELEKGE